jgi:tetratricopeptide (TPR) repeat protein
MLRLILETTTSRRLLSNGRLAPVRSLSTGMIGKSSGLCQTRRYDDGLRNVATSYRSTTTVPSMARCRCFSTDASLAQKDSSVSLGIFETVVKPHLDSLSSLPEVSAALANPMDTSTNIEGLNRAVQIFESMGGPMHAAVQGLLADAYQQSGQYKQAIQVLEQLLQGDSAANYVKIQLGLSKALFYDGDFDRASQVTSELLESPEVQSSVVTRGTVLCAQGTVQLLQLTKDCDYEVAQEVIKVLRVAAQSLESHGGAGTAAYNNLGVAQVYAELAFLDSVRIDSAMSCFHQGLEMCGDDNDLLKARIYCNLAHTLLIEDYGDEDMLKLASEYSREALGIYEKSTQLADMEKQGGLGRALNLVASCYVHADAAVTAEGLFQSAIDMPGVDPLTRIARREVYRSYAELCRKWDKRQADMERLDQQSVDINDSLASGWADKPAITSGLIFPTL